MAMRDSAEHASWWDRELKLLWPQVGTVLGDHAASLLGEVLPGVNGILTHFGVPSTLRGRPSHEVTREPSATPSGSRLSVELPDGASVLGPFHRITVPINAWGIGPATIRLNFAADIDPTAHQSGLNFFPDIDVKLEIGDVFEWLLGLKAIEHTLDWGGPTILAEVVGFGAVDLDAQVPSFSRLRYSRRELNPSSVAPQMVRGDIAAPPMGSDRIDYWDIVFIADGLDPAPGGTYDEIVQRAALVLKPEPAELSLVNDVGAGAWNAYRDAIRIWSIPLAHDSPRLSTDDNDASALRDMAAIAESGLIFEDELISEYPDTPPKLGRATWVIARPGSEHATTFGNFILLPVDAGDTAENRVRVLIHELGHIRFVGLGDEYVDPAELDLGEGLRRFFAPRLTREYLGPEPRQANLSTSSQPDKWAAFSTTITPTNGAYELYESHIYRPDPRCRMNRPTGDHMQGFCPVCADAITNGVVDYLAAGSRRLLPPLELRIEFDWPFAGRRDFLLAAGIGPGGHIPQVRLPYFEHHGVEYTRTGATRTARSDLSIHGSTHALRASAPRPLIGEHQPLNVSAGELRRVEIEGTHPNIGFSDAHKAMQAADLSAVERLRLEDFDFEALADLEQLYEGSSLFVGTEIHPEIDSATGNLKIGEIRLQARGGRGSHGDLRLATASMFHVSSGRDENVWKSFNDGPGEPTLRSFAFRGIPRSGGRNDAATRDLVGTYRWNVESRLAAEPRVSRGASPYVLESSELELGPDGYHFAIGAPEPVDEPPVTPRLIASDKVRVSFAVPREGSAEFTWTDASTGDRDSWARSGILSLSGKEREQILGDRQVFRLPGLSGSMPQFGGIGGIPGPFGRPFGEGGGFGPDDEPVPSFGRDQGGRPTIREPGREAPREFIFTKMIVMIAWSFSPALEPLLIHFQTATEDGDFSDVPPDEISALQRGTAYSEPDEPRRSLRTTYWEYRDWPTDHTRWRCRAIDESGRRSGWSDPAPLFDFHPGEIPGRLGVPID